MIPMGNAAGWLKRPADIDEILKVPSDIVQFVTLGSYTLEKRDGNPGDNFANFINALGLPNPGLDEAKDFLPDMIKRIRDSGKWPRVNIAEFSIEGYVEAARIVTALRPDEIEINLGCPNVWAGDKQKPIASFVPDLVAKILDEVDTVTDHLGAPRIAVKLSPYSDPSLLKKVAGVLAARQHMLNNVVTSNTLPNALGFNAETGAPLIAQKYGGLSGHAMKHIALGQAAMFREQLPQDIAVTVVGGIDSGIDLRDAELAGAQYAQVGTAFFLGGPRVFQSIVEEFVALS